MDAHWASTNKLGFIGEIVDATLASLREGGGCRRYSEGECEASDKCSKYHECIR